MSLHLTYTGVNAGTYLCLRYRQQLGSGSRGRREPGDTAAHFAYAAPQLLTAESTCPDCRHVAACPTPETCSRCAALGYQSITPTPASTR
jgi:hypothetical protein